nr:proteinaceous RNase P 1, chloroplastic/mitochondrial-like [Ipomoea batatas]GME15248.1 proteinaceous RNase P 1, chloroplastic/mitochondrial-like [Ipomoea batatas]
MACASASFTFKPLQKAQLHLSSFSYCKYSSMLNPFKIYSSYFPSTKLTLEVETHVTRLETDREISRIIPRSVNHSETGSGLSSFSSKVSRVSRKHSKNNHAVENVEKRVVLKEGHGVNGLNSRKRGELSPEISIVKSKNGSSGKKDEKSRRVEHKSRKNDGKEVAMEQKEKGSSKVKVHSPEAKLRLGLDMCSKRGDFLGAIRLYELARKEGVRIGQYHYSVLLYLCSSAATGFLQPAKSGSGSRSLNPLESKEVSSVGFEDNSEFSQMENRKLYGGENGLTVDSSLENHLQHNSQSTFSWSESLSKPLDSSPQTLDELVQLMKTSVKPSEVKDVRDQQEGYVIQVGQDVKSFALRKGFEICELMRLEKVPMNEATFTSMARLAMSLGDGDKAFDVVKQMKECGIDPRLRSYGPALSVFCNSGDVEKAFMVEGHMLENGVYPEEPELEALLKLSVEAKRSDKVYYLLHKLRMSVRQVSPYTADLIEEWFHSKAASEAGKRKWDQRLIRKAIENGGGGWHGQGWLGNGKWTVLRTSVGSDGFCKCCGEQLATIDLDPEETENFAKSVASIASQREKNLNFQKFQKWLDDHGPFEAVVDGANVGLFSQGKFQPSKVNAVANGIRQMLPSKRWPLIILHNRRVSGDMMRKPSNKALAQKWRTADALYETPTGSNDDWYWLYAAIKFRCLMVTNDEMRDHLFQLLGNDFFLKWKERHQVHFGFSEIGPVFHMPPPYSVVIQESEKGHWHIPIASELESEGDRTWLCVTRTNPHTTGKNSPNVSKETEVPSHKEKDASSSTQKKTRKEVTRRKHGHGNNEISPEVPKETCANLKAVGVLQSSRSPNQKMVRQELEAAETHGSCIIDFQI